MNKFQRKGISKMKRKIRNFTLVELLITISILAILIVILLPALGKAMAKAQDISCKSNLKQLGNYITLYINDNDSHVVINLFDWDWSRTGLGTMIKPYSPKWNAKDGPGTVGYCPAYRKREEYMSSYGELRSSMFIYNLNTCHWFQPAGSNLYHGKLEQITKTIWDGKPVRWALISDEISLNTHRSSSVWLNFWRIDGSIDSFSSKKALPVPPGNEGKRGWGDNWWYYHENWMGMILKK